MVQLKKKDILYYARIIPKTRIYEVCEVVVRTIKENWFVAIDKRDKHAYLFAYDDVDKILFSDRKDALIKVIETEKNAPHICYETYYEEY